MKQTCPIYSNKLKARWQARHIPGVWPIACDCLYPTCYDAPVKNIGGSAYDLGKAVS
jgi:hypothetical protein